MADLREHARLLICMAVLAAHAGAQPTCVVCVGNSITAGSGYVSQFTGLLGLSYLVYNKGFGGACMLKDAQTVDGVPLDSYWYSTPFQEVFGCEPNVVTVMLGTNDGKYYNWENHGHAFYDDCCALIDTFLTIPTVERLFVCLPPPVLPPSCCDIIPAYVNDSIVPLVDSAAHDRGATVVDCHTPMLGHPEYFGADGVHPSYDGALVIADVLHAAVTGSSAVRPIVPVGASGPVPREGARLTVWPGQAVTVLSRFTLLGRTVRAVGPHGR